MEKKWDKQKVIEEILKLRKAGGKLNCWHVQRNNRALYGAACVYLGGWKNAIKTSGIRYSKVRLKRAHPRWEEKGEGVIKTIREIHQAGGKLNSNYVQLRNRALYAAAVKYFKSWGKAIEIAGFNYGGIRIWDQHVWTKDKIIRAIRRRKRKGLPINGAAVSLQSGSLYKAAARHFGKGGWAKALRKAGYDPKDLNPQKIWSKVRIVKKIRNLKREGIPLYPNYLKTHNEYRGLYSIANHYFGSWKKAIRCAGFDYEKIRKGRYCWWNRGRIIAMIRLLEKRGERLNSKFTQQTRGDLFGAAVVYFGSWSQAVEAAGIDYLQYCKIWSYKAWIRKLTSDELTKITDEAVKLVAQRKERKNDRTAIKRGHTNDSA